MILKPTVKLEKLQPQICIALFIADRIYNEHGYNMVVTSVIDGKHMVGSLHYTGNAADLRTNYLNPDDKITILKYLKEALGSQFDVIDENDHIHIEFDPR